MQESELQGGATQPDLAHQPVATGPQPSICRMVVLGTDLFV